MKQLMILSLLMLAVNPAAAQGTGDGFQPLNDRLPPGYNADVLRRIAASDSNWLQPVSVHLPSAGRVSVHAGASEAAATGMAPAQFAATPGFIYRLQVSEMPEFPEQTFYPSVELLDRLHPPAGLEHRFPVPIVFTMADFKAASEGLLVTRVVYLENPRVAASNDPLLRDRALSGDAQMNALAAAGRQGRPMLIIRLGGRTPGSGAAVSGFFGNGGLIGPSSAAGPDTGVARMGFPRRIQQVSARR